MDGMIRTNRAMRKALEKENEKWPEYLREMPKEMWPFEMPKLHRVLRSRLFLVQIFHVDMQPPAVYRMSVNRTSVDAKVNRWSDGGIDWDTLQRLKREAGYADMWAVEIFPPDEDVINVGNLRHLWLLNDKPAYAW